jgi:hypothetical protein
LLTIFVQIFYYCPSEVIRFQGWVSYSLSCGTKCTVHCACSGNAKEHIPERLGCSCSCIFKTSHQDRTTSSSKQTGASLWNCWITCELTSATMRKFMIAGVPCICFCTLYHF